MRRNRILRFCSPFTFQQFSLSSFCSLYCKYLVLQQYSYQRTLIRRVASSQYRGRIQNNILGVIAILREVIVQINRSSGLSKVFSELIYYKVLGGDMTPPVSATEFDLLERRKKSSILEMVAVKIIFVLYCKQ